MITKIQSFELNGKEISLLTDGDLYAVVSDYRFRLFEGFGEASEAYDEAIVLLDRVCNRPMAECMDCLECPKEKEE